MGNGSNISGIIGAAQFVSEQQEAQRKRIFDEEVGLHLEALGENPDYVPSSDYDPRAFHMAQVDVITKQLGQERLRAAQMENIKADIDLQHAAITKTWLKAEGALALGNEEGFLMFSEQAYDGLVDGTDLTIDKENNTLIFNNMDGSVDRKEFTGPTARQDMIDFITTSARPMMDATTFAQRALVERQKINMYNVDRWTQPQVYTNEKGEKLHAITKLRDPRTGKPFQGEYEGMDFKDGNIFYDPKSGKIISASEVVKRGFMSPEQMTALKQVETEEAKAEKARKEGKAPSMSPEEKLADGLVRKGIFGSGEEAMRFAVSMTQAKNRNDFIEKLQSLGIDSDDPDYEKFLKVWEASQPQLPKRKGSNKGLPGAEGETKPSITQRIEELKNIPGMTRAKAKKILMDEYPEAFKK